MITWSCEITWQTKIIMDTKCGKMLSYLDELLPIKSHDPKKSLPANLASRWLAMMDFHPCYSSFWSCGLARPCDKLKPLYLQYHNIYCHKARQDGYSCLDCLLPTKSYDHIITSFCEITWQTKNIVYPLAQCLWPQNVAGWWLTLSDFYP